MSKKAVSLADLIERKKQSNGDKLQVKYYKSKTLGVEIEVRKLPLKRFYELSEQVGNDENNTIDSMNQMIYECCPIFKTDVKEAMEYYGVAEPTDLPSAVLEDNVKEMNEIVELVNTFYGIGEIEKKVKN